MLGHPAIGARCHSGRLSVSSHTRLGPGDSERLGSHWWPLGGSAQDRARAALHQMLRCPPDAQIGSDVSDRFRSAGFGGCSDRPTRLRPAASFQIGFRLVGRGRFLVSVR